MKAAEAWSVSPAMPTRFQPGQRVRVRDASPPGHLRTPWYVRGRIGEVERLLDWCGEQGFVFAAQSAQMEKMPNLALLQNAKYQALVDKIIERRRKGVQPMPGRRVTGAKSGKRISGRSGVSKLQQLLDIAREDLGLVLRA